MIGVLLVALGAAVGGPLRYLVDRAVQARHRSLMPWGTISVNVVGSGVLGLLVGLGTGHDVPREVVLALGVGFCGALTTFSTFSFESFQLLQTGAKASAALNVVVSVVACLAAVTLGHALGAAL